MKDIFSCKVDSDVLGRFHTATKLVGSNPENIIEDMMKSYISESFGKISREYVPNTILGKNNKSSVYGKAHTRIPKWAIKPHQNNHKIVRAYIELENEIGRVLLEELEERCSDKVDHEETYVKDFKGNFNQMKIDSPKSHGKVFEIENGYVIIWSEIKDTLNQYSNLFINGRV